MRENNDEQVEIRTEEVQSSEKKTNHHSASGLDQVTCAVLQPIFTRLFQQSLDTYHLPILWKTVIIIPVPKKPSPKVQNDFRPVALTSVPFKYMDRLILRRLSRSYPLQARPNAVWILRKQKHRGCHTDTVLSCVQTLGEAEIVCTTAVPGLLECIQHHPAALDVEEGDG